MKMPANIRAKIMAKVQAALDKGSEVETFTIQANTPKGMVRVELTVCQGGPEGTCYVES